MAESRRQRMRDATVAEIKHIATGQMAADGTAGLSLRGIAQEMGVTPPALYRYFRSRDDLITALILDAYNDLAATLERAVADRQDRGIGDLMLVGLLAYREWALAHPTEYQLILGNPIPGYSAPSELTTPAARRSLGVFARLVGEAYACGELPVPADQAGKSPPAEALAGVLSTWAHAHGLITLELFGHLQPIIGDAGTLYRAEMEETIRRLGVPLHGSGRGDAESEADVSK